MKNLIKILFTFFAIALLTGCASTKSATSSLEINLTPPEGKALIYIVRPKLVGAAIPFKVTVDETYIGKTTGKKYLYAFIESGQHTIWSKAENNAELQIDLKPGQTYFIEQTPKMGVVIARNKLSLLDDAEGKSKLGKCKLSKYNIQK